MSWYRNWEDSEKMTDAEAIRILSVELWHTESHKRIEGKASKYYEELSQIAEALQMAIEALKNERPQGEWIPVSERLPEDMQRVLIWFEYYRYGDFNCMYQTYGFGYVCDGEWSPLINGETGWQDSRIIAWQPLPESYKEGSRQ